MFICFKLLFACCTRTKSRINVFVENENTALNLGRLIRTDSFEFNQVDNIGWINEIILLLGAYEKVDEHYLNSIKPSLKTFIEKVESCIFVNDENIFSTLDSLPSEELTKKNSLIIQTVLETFIRIFGRYSYTKLSTASLLIEDGNIRFLNQPWQDFYDICKELHFQLPHFLPKLPYQGYYPPKTANSITTLIYTQDSIYFGLDMIYEIEGKEMKFNCPDIPTDIIEPRYIRDKDVAIDKLVEYNLVISQNLIRDLGLITSFKKRQVSTKVPLAFGARKFAELYLKKVKSISENIGDMGVRNIFEVFAKHTIYQIVCFGKDDLIKNFRLNIKDFLQKNRGTLTLPSFLNPNHQISIGALESDIVLTQDDINEKYRQDMLKSFKSKDFRHTKEYQPNNLLLNLKDPIIDFGNMIKDMAISLSSIGSKIAIIPLTIFSHGLAQRMTEQDIFTSQATETIKIENLQWNCWTCDGANLIEFKNKYPLILQAFLEGKLNLFFFEIKDNQDTNFIGAVNIISGALTLETIKFSEIQTKGYRTFKNINSLDNSFFIKAEVL